MLKEYCWNTFENTGSIDAYILYKLINENKNSNKENEEAIEDDVAIIS